MGYPATKPQVMKYMMDNPGRNIHKEEIGRELGLLDSQVNNAIGNLIRDDQVPGLKRVVRGSVYRYDPDQVDPNGAEADFYPEDPIPFPQDATADMEQWFEQVGVTKAGPIVRGPEGTLYRLEAL
jgi:hypothetical protein